MVYILFSPFDDLIQALTHRSAKMENTQIVCSEECRQHIFSIKGPKDKQFNCSLILCPRLCLDSKKYHNFPVFNHDQKQYTSAFVNRIDSQVLLEFQKEQISQFNEKCQKAQLEKEQLEFPEPPPKKNYCFICQCEFQCYFQHILSHKHKQLQQQNHSSNLISDACLRFTKKQGVINAPPPFQLLQNCPKDVESSLCSHKSCVKQRMEKNGKSSSSHGPLSEKERQVSEQSVELHEKEPEQSSDQVIITEVRPAKHPPKHKPKEENSESEQSSRKKKKEKGKKIQKKKKKSSKSKSKSKKDKKSKKKLKKKKKVVKQEQVYSQSQDQSANEHERSDNILQDHQYPQVKLAEEQVQEEEDDIIIQKVQKSRAVLDLATQKIVQGLVQEVKKGIFDPPRKYRKASDFQCRRMDYDSVAIDKNAGNEQKQDNYYYYYDKNQNLKMKAKKSDKNTLNAPQGQQIVDKSVKSNSEEIIQIDKEGHNHNQDEQLSETVSANASKKIVPSHVLEFKKKFPYEYYQKSTQSILKSSIEDSLLLKRQSQGYSEDPLQRQNQKSSKQKYKNQKSSKQKYSNPHMPRMMPGPNGTHIQQIIEIDLEQDDNRK